MALPKKNSRTITVAGIPVRWFFVSKAARFRASMFLIAQHERGQKLVVDLGIVDDDSGKIGGPERHLLPGLVAKLLNAALARRWTPLQSKAEMTVRFKDLLPNEPLPPRWKEDPGYYRKTKKG